jgi:predicted nucleotidyltransferase
MYIAQYIRENGKEFQDLCMQFQVKSLYAFGSSTNENFDQQKSDIDLVIELKSEDPLQRGEILIQIWDKLEYFFKRRVDLITLSSLKNPILKKNIDNNKVLIYENS